MGTGFEGSWSPTMVSRLGSAVRGFKAAGDGRWAWSLGLDRIGEDEIEDDPVKMKQFVLSKHLWDLIWGNISKGKFGVLGDAFHPMTPDIGQVLVLYLEDGIVLARCLARALLTKEQSWELKKRKLIVKRQVDGKLTTFLRDKLLAAFLSELLLKKADFDCGKLSIS
ncbi:monooxygenase 3-like [Quercus suber]|uniref:monooxygenase 3-like n=1 Tax=Quercus suber TaxID=58331 RepID=UPI0032DFBF9E